MPIHDWTRVDHGTFHDFHVLWSVALSNALNAGVLPADYYAMVEQHAGEGKPDVAPPRVRLAMEAGADDYTDVQKSIAIRHVNEDRGIALIELVSPGNKSSRHGIRSLTEKVIGSIERGLHVLAIDLLPPGPRDPSGIHPLIWSEFRDEDYILPAEKPLTLVSYSAGSIKRAYIESVAIGDGLPDMPLFLEPGAYVNVPLETTYQIAWGGFPRQLKPVLEG